MVPSLQPADVVRKALFLCFAWSAMATSRRVPAEVELHPAEAELARRITRAQQLLDMPDGDKWELNEAIKVEADAKGLADAELWRFLSADHLARKFAPLVDLLQARTQQQVGTQLSGWAIHYSENIVAPLLSPETVTRARAALEAADSKKKHWLHPDGTLNRFCLAPDAGHVLEALREAKREEYQAKEAAAKRHLDKLLREKDDHTRARIKEFVELYEWGEHPKQFILGEPSAQLVFCSRTM